MRASSWVALVETSHRDASTLLERALAMEPRLTRTGLGVPHESLKRPDRVALELDEERLELNECVVQVAACADWLKLQRHLNAFTRQTSYSRKHDVELWFRYRGASSLTVCNGAVIVAALGLGIEGRILGDGPNMVFKLAQGPSSIEHWERERRTADHLG